MTPKSISVQHRFRVTVDETAEKGDLFAKIERLKFWDAESDMVQIEFRRKLENYSAELFILTGPRSTLIHALTTVVQNLKSPPIHD